MTGQSPAIAVRSRIATAARSGKLWLQTDRRMVSYAELDKRIALMAALAGDRGLRPGDRVAIATGDDAESSLLFAALIFNGLTVVILEPENGPERARNLVNKAAPALVIIDAALAAHWQLPAAVPAIPIVAQASGGGLLGGLLKPRAKSGLAAELDRLKEADPPENIPDNTLAYIMFTSGTTQAPKGVCISHHALFSHLETLSRVYGYDADSVILNTLMLSHADGMIQGPLIALYNLAQIQRPVAFAINTIEPLLDAVYRLRVTHMVVVPTILALMARLSQDQDDAFKGGDFKLLLCCGAALDAGLWQHVEQKFAVNLINMYGLTETVAGGVFAGAAVGAPVPGTIGRPIDCELRIVDDAGQDVAKGADGELLMRGDLLMSGYFDAEELTREAIDPEGWFHTGDIANQGADGLYRISGRKKNIIIRGGLNIHPEEVSDVLANHPTVREAVAFGVADPDWGERLIAVVVADAVNEDDLLRYCAEALDVRKVPSRIVIAEALPRGRSGKVVIEAARALYEAAKNGGTQTNSDGRTTAGKNAGGGDDAEQRLFAVAARCFHVDATRLTASSRPVDVVGWDSLAHMDFVIALEQEFGVILGPREVMALDSLGKALALVAPR